MTATRKHIDKSRGQEVVIYCVVWAVVFIVPTLTHYVQSILSNDIVDWTFLRLTWLNASLFFILFWIHDLFIAPLLFSPKNRKDYVLYVVILILLYAIIQMVVLKGSRPPVEGMMPPEMAARPGMPPPRPTPVNPEGIIRIIIAMMMCGANIGIKYYFRSQHEEALSLERERQGLSKEIEFLTYQISPHFFMNTLNNIHALIDIDPEKAKNTIIELSRMMRYALYEGRAEVVPLKKEINFINHYIALMRLRYTDNVDITTDFCSVGESVRVPPLLLITFVENAFKHGISYRKASYIHMKLRADDGHITFSCVNSSPRKDGSESHGMGLENVKERLRLIYGAHFQLTIDNREDTFSVLLTIPTSNDNKMYSNGRRAIGSQPT